MKASQEFTENEIKAIGEYLDDIATIQVLRMWQLPDLISGFEKLKASITPKPVEIKKSADDYFSSF
ncbi:hypothetical protein ACWATR_38320 [Nostoc sp. UIC 10890]